MAKISVLMPFYNADKYLAEAMDSIVNQTYTDWELIAINDGSTDRSEEIVLAYTDPRIVYRTNKSNLGLIQTLNSGIDYCTGEYIARMDADDIAMPTRLAEQVHFLDRHLDYIVCGTNAKRINSEGRQVGSIKNLTKDSYLQVNLLFSIPFVHPTMLIRRSVLLANRYSEDYRHIEDYELWCRLASVGKLANIDRELLAYRWHDNNVSVVYEEQQQQLKNNIIAQQLVRMLNLEPTIEEMYCHTLSYHSYACAMKEKISTIQLKAVEAWFEKLLAANKSKRRYKQNEFRAFVWSRWIVLCIRKKRYKFVFFPRFGSFNPLVLGKLIRLVFLLAKK